MDDKNNQAVVSMASHKTNSLSKTEVESARSCISILSWDMQTQQIFALCGLSVSTAILEDGAEPLLGSHAANLGHKTVRELIESSEDSNGLGLSWDEFKPKLSARVFRDKFAIQESDYVEINNLVEDVSSELGRMAHDAAEFHGTKNRILMSKIEQIRIDSEANQKSLQETQRNLIKENTRLTEENRNNKEKLGSLSEESAKKIQDAYREAAKKIEENEQLVESQKQEMRRKIEQETEEQMDRAKGEMAAKIQKTEAQMLRVQSELSAIQSQIESGELVKKERVGTLMADLEKAVSQELMAKRSADDLRSNIATMESRIKKITAEKGQVEAKLSETSKHIQGLEDQLRDSLETRLNGPEFAIFQERLAHMRESNTLLSAEVDAKSLLLEKAETERNQATGRYQELHREGKSYTESLKADISNQREAISAFKEQIKNISYDLTAYQYENKSLKRALGVMSVMVLVIAASFMTF